MLAAIGIVKGEPFTPDAHTRESLDQAAKTAYKMSRVIGFEEVLNDGSLRMYSDRRWINPLDNVTPPSPRTTVDLSWKRVAGGISTSMPGSGSSPTTIRSARYDLPNPGKGAKYMIAFGDSAGAPLSGGTSYRLNLPANIPAANFWSLTREQVGSSSFEKTDWIQAPKKIDQRADQPGPACLVAGADARTIVAMEIFEK
jgi:hypothetical protein